MSTRTIVRNSGGFKMGKSPSQKRDRELNAMHRERAQEIICFDCIYISILKGMRNQNRHDKIIVIRIKISMRTSDNEPELKDRREAASAPEERPMRKWFATLAVLGIGGIGAFLLSEKGREILRGWVAEFQDGPDQWNEWSESAQLELANIQAALNRIAQSLEPHSELGR
jgi:hypothetical protein